MYNINITVIRDSTLEEFKALINKIRDDGKLLLYKCYLFRILAELEKESFTIVNQQKYLLLNQYYINGMFVNGFHNQIQN